MTPRVSVIVPCFNLGRYLDEAVDSVLAQTFQDFEILIVDDGSTEPETRDRLAAFSRPECRVLRSENRGLPAAKNLGLMHTTGPYVCMLDADDRLAPAMLEKSVAVLDADPSIAFVSHWLRTFGDDETEWTPEGCDFPALLDMNTVNGSALVRRSALEAVGGFDETFREGCEDWDLWITMVERGFTGTILPEVLFFYRRRSGSMSRTMLAEAGHPALYRRIARKHAASFAAYAAPLLSRREEHIATLRVQIHDLDLEHHSALAATLAHRRDELAILERKASDYQRELERNAHIEAVTAECHRLAEQCRLMDRERGRLAATLDESMRTSSHLGAQLRTAVDRAFELDAAANRALQEVRELRQSASWRLTAPLRRLYGWLGRR